MPKAVGGTVPAGPSSLVAFFRQLPDTSSQLPGRGTESPAAGASSAPTPKGQRGSDDVWKSSDAPAGVPHVAHSAGCSKEKLKPVRDCLGAHRQQTRVSAACSPAIAQCFAVGDQVMAKYANGKWYPAVVEERLVDLDNIKFRLAWCDGDSRCREKLAQEMMHLGDYEMLEHAGTVHTGAKLERHHTAGGVSRRRGSDSGDGRRSRREVVKRKRLIEDEDFDAPGVKRSLLTCTIKRLKAAACFAAHHLGDLLAGWSGTKHTFEIGDNVMARYTDGEWYAAVVAEKFTEMGESKFRVEWDDGDGEHLEKRAKDMMMLEDFTKRAEKALEKKNKRQEEAESCKREEAAKAAKVGQDKDKDVGKAMCTAVYTFKVSAAAAVSSESTAFHRRDWGLRMVRTVGRNTPPFCRTILFRGTLPFEQSAVGPPIPEMSGHFVVKRWPPKASAGRKRTDKEVHECIRDHPNPNLVRILDVSPTEGVLMEYFEDGDLQTHMATARRKYLPVLDILNYVVQIVKALEHLHALGIVHCDVAPANIFLRRNRAREEALEASAESDEETSIGSTKRRYYSCALGDFGHSYMLERHDACRSSVAQQGIGALFVAPEVRGGSNSTKESDVYSAGKILEELLNLSSAFKHEMQLESKAEVRQLRGLASEMCCADTDMRPAAGAICKRLESLVSSST